MGMGRDQGTRNVAGSGSHIGEHRDEQIDQDDTTDEDGYHGQYVCDPLLDGILLKLIVHVVLRLPQACPQSKEELASRVDLCADRLVNRRVVVPHPSEANVADHQRPGDAEKQQQEDPQVSCHVPQRLDENPELPAPDAQKARQLKPLHRERKDDRRLVRLKVMPCT